MEEDLYAGAPLQAYLALVQKYYTEDRLELAMRVAQDAFAHEGWQPGLWTALFNELQCEYDAREASDAREVDEGLTLEVPRTEPEDAADLLMRTSMEAREKARDILAAELAKPITVTIFLPDAPIGFIVGTYGYVMHKTGVDKICLPHYILQSPVEMRNALTHEFTHAATHELAGEELPHWLDEGVAEYVEGMPPEAVIQNAASQYPKLLSLSKAEGAFANADLRKDQPGMVVAAYKLSAAFIDWWTATYGLSTLRQALRNIGRGQSVPRAIGRATGHSLRSMERDWRRPMQNKS